MHEDCGRGQITNFSKTMYILDLHFSSFDPYDEKEH